MQPPPPSLPFVEYVLKALEHPPDMFVSKLAACCTMLFLTRTDPVLLRSLCHKWAIRFSMDRKKLTARTLARMHASRGHPTFCRNASTDSFDDLPYGLPVSDADACVQHFLSIVNSLVPMYFSWNWRKTEQVIQVNREYEQYVRREILPMCFATAAEDGVDEELLAPPLLLPYSPCSSAGALYQSPVSRRESASQTPHGGIPADGSMGTSEEAHQRGTNVSPEQVGLTFVTLSNFTEAVKHSHNGLVLVFHARFSAKSTETLGMLQEIAAKRLLDPMPNICVVHSVAEPELAQLYNVSWLPTIVYIPPTEERNPRMGDLERKKEQRRREMSMSRGGRTSCSGPDGSPDEGSESHSGKMLFPNPEHPCHCRIYSQDHTGWGKMAVGGLLTRALRPSTPLISPLGTLIGRDSAKHTSGGGDGELCALKPSACGTSPHEVMLALHTPVDVCHASRGGAAYQPSCASPVSQGDAGGLGSTAVSRDEMSDASVNGGAPRGKNGVNGSSSCTTAELASDHKLLSLPSSVSECPMTPPTTNLFASAAPAKGAEGGGLGRDDPPMRASTGSLASLRGWVSPRSLGPDTTVAGSPCFYGSRQTAMERSVEGAHRLPPGADDPGEFEFMSETEEFEVSWVAAHDNHKVYPSDAAMNLESLREWIASKGMIVQQRSQEKHSVLSLRMLKEEERFRKAREQHSAMVMLRRLQGLGGSCAALEPHFQPMFIFLGGGMAAGKTTAATALAQSEWWKRHKEHAVLVNADEFKLSEPVPLAFEPIMHERSTRDAEYLLVQAVNQGRCVVLDGTMMWAPFVKQVVDMVRNAHNTLYRQGDGYSRERGVEEYFVPAGARPTPLPMPYQIRLLAITVEPEIAVPRGFLRQFSTGRAVPISAQLRSFRLFAENFPLYMDLVDFTTLYNNNVFVDLEKGELPPVLAERSDVTNMKFKVYDDDAYQLFLKQRTLNDDAANVLDLFPPSPSSITGAKSTCGHIVSPPSAVTPSGPATRKVRR